MLDLVGLVPNVTDLTTVYHRSGVRSFASDAFCFRLVSPVDLGFMTVMGDNGLYPPAINRWTSLELGRNNGMEGFVSSPGFPDFHPVCALD